MIMYVKITMWNGIINDVSVHKTDPDPENKLTNEYCKEEDTGLRIFITKLWD